MTDEWRLDLLVARVVAWHNRHPLARRITAQQVRSLGFVALPFAVPRTADAADAAATGPACPAGTSAAPSSAAAPVRQRGRSGAMNAAFSEDFIAPMAPARVARWAARHAREAASAPMGAPMRQVAVDEGRVAFGHGVVVRYAMTAAVQAAGARSRLLIGPDARSPVLGRRLWSRPRATFAGGGALAALALVVAMALKPAEPTALLAAAPVITAAAPVVPAVPTLDEAPPGRHAPPDAEPRLGRVELPPLVPQLVPPIDDAVRAAARQARADLIPPQQAMARPEPAPPVALGLPAATLPDTPRSPTPTATAVPPEAFWALTTRLLRTRAESMQLMQAVDALLREHAGQDLKVEMLPSGDDWRVVGWPFRHRADAERARAMLLARGLKVEVVDF
ncbi:MAG: hypothetical protein U5L05_01520 [Rubrivivax sp.]|nr:hypothetical protein [Rubrivivax sp.]